MLNEAYKQKHVTPASVKSRHQAVKRDGCFAKEALSAFREVPTW